MSDLIAWAATAVLLVLAFLIVRVASRRAARRRPSDEDRRS